MGCGDGSIHALFDQEAKPFPASFLAAPAARTTSGLSGVS
jgi:hypothetical protein